MLVPMEQEKENEDKQDTNGRTAGILNGDIGDGNMGQEDEGSSPQADWTGTESHTGNEDSAGTESEHGQSEGVADHKVGAPLLCAVCLEPATCAAWPLCTRCKTGSSVLNSLLGFANAAMIQCVFVCVCSNSYYPHMPWG